MSEREDEVFERQLEWGVAELTRREAPTDLTAAVLSRLGEAPADPLPRSRAWLAAAIGLLALAVVFGVRSSLESDEVDPGPEPAAGGVQDPALVPLEEVAVTVVRQRREIESLPSTVEGVELIGLGFEAIDALRKRCPYVRMLRLRGPEVEGGVLFRAMWLRHLRHLDLVECPNVPENVVAEFASHRQLALVLFGDVEWLEESHLARLVQGGIEPRLLPGHPKRAIAERLVRDHTDRLQERRLAGVRPIPFAVVRSITDIAALPADTVAVDGLNLRDEQVGALARLDGLRYLRLRSGVQARELSIPDREAPYRPSTDEGNRASVTDAGLAQLIPLDRLETLELAGTVEVKGEGLRHLARLPKLRELALIAVDTSDAGLAHLPNFPALQSLRLERNHGFSRPGLGAIARCEHLQTLVLTACIQLAGSSYEELCELSTLRDLRLLQLGVDNWRNDNGRRLNAAEAAAAAQTRAEAENRIRRIDDGVVGELAAALSGLERFELTFAWISDEALRAIGKLKDLRRLGLAGNADITATGLARLPVGLRHLDLGGCTAVGDGLNGVVRSRLRELVSLRVDRLDELTRLDGVVTAAGLRELSLWGCRGFGAEAADDLRGASQLRFVDLSAARGLPAGITSELQARGVVVKHKVW